MKRVYLSRQKIYSSCRKDCMVYNAKNQTNDGTSIVGVPSFLSFLFAGGLLAVLLLGFHLGAAEAPC